MNPTDADTLRILVYRLGQIGDTVVALPSLWAIRSEFPSAHITLFTERNADSRYVSAGSVLPKEGLIDEVLCYDSGGPLFLSPQTVRLVRDLRQRHYDMLVYLAPRLRGQWKVYRDLSFFRLAGIRRFIGHHGFGHSLPLQPNGMLGLAIHEADHLLGRLGADGVSIDDHLSWSMDLRLGFDEQASAVSWLTKNVGSGWKSLCLIAIASGSKAPSKIWPKERYVELGKKLVDQVGAFPIILGGFEDRKLGDELVSQWGIGANAAGALRVRESAAVLKNCALYVGNDTGAMHLAAAVQTKCVAIFSARDWPGRWHPYGQGHIVLRKSVPCEGCLSDVCKEGTLRCLTLISVDEVFSACKEILES